MNSESTGAFSLDQETKQQLTLLVGLLETEQEALKQRNFEEIESCVKDKENILGQLEELERKRVQLMQDPGEETRLLLEKCRELNKVNGGIVEVSRQFNQRMLDTLLGSDAGENGLYDAAGNKPAHAHRQVMAKI